MCYCKPVWWMMTAMQGPRIPIKCDRCRDYHPFMDLEHYKALLLTKERELVAQRARSGEEEQEAGDGGAAGDVGDESVRDEEKAEVFAQDESDASTLDDVRLALGRIADGSYGLCLEDDQPIEKARLEAVPWAKYCTRHQSAIEARQGLRTPSL
jgi:DnaK suppressor protein